MNFSAAFEFLCVLLPRALCINGVVQLATVRRRMLQRVSVEGLTSCVVRKWLHLLDSGWVCGDTVLGGGMDGPVGGLGGSRDFWIVRTLEKEFEVWVGGVVSWGVDMTARATMLFLILASVCGGVPEEIVWGSWDNAVGDNSPIHWKNQDRVMYIDVTEASACHKESVFKVEDIEFVKLTIQKVYHQIYEILGKETNLFSAAITEIPKIKHTDRQESYKFVDLQIELISVSVAFCRDLDLLCGIQTLYWSLRLCFTSLISKASSLLENATIKQPRSFGSFIGDTKKTPLVTKREKTDEEQWGEYIATFGLSKDAWCSAFVEFVRMDETKLVGKFGHWKSKKYKYEEEELRSMRGVATELRVVILAGSAAMKKRINAVCHLRSMRIAERIYVCAVLLFALSWPCAATPQNFVITTALRTVDLLSAQSISRISSALIIKNIAAAKTLEFYFAVDASLWKNGNLSFISVEQKINEKKIPLVFRDDLLDKV
ncbi:hypothetical protein HK096_008243, partial [Nowakowskiella sp. JEL0078]